MRDARRILPWIVLGLAGALAAAWAFPRAFPLFPRDWTVTAPAAEAIALERFRDLGEPVAEPYVVIDRTPSIVRERRLLTTPEASLETLAESPLGDPILGWRVRVYAPGAGAGDWTYQALLGADGDLGGLRLRVDPEADAEEIEPTAAVAAADAFLARLGVDLDRYERPVLRRQDLANRTDLVVRYRDREALLGAAAPYGLEVHFAGDQLVGFDSFFDDPEKDRAESELQLSLLWEQLFLITLFLLVPLVGVLFLRRYHEGEIGVRQALRIFGLLAAAGTVVVVTSAVGSTEGVQFGLLTRRQTTWAWGLQILVIFFLPFALLSALSWSVGESACREGWSRKLAAFDALLRRRWDTATVARASLRGLGAGLALAGGLLAAAVAVQPLGVWPISAFLMPDFWGASRLPGLGLLALALVVVSYRELFGRLLLVTLGVRRLGRVLGVTLAVVVGGLFLFPVFQVTPLSGAIAFWLAAAGVLVGLYLAYDLLTVLLASLTAEVTMGALPLIHSQAPALEAQGWLVLAVVALPAALSLRHLGSGREFVYRWDDVPPHVRRIAERERQRVELETARRIQSSILPELPPRLAGVDIAYAYLPASEVGGDFYDVLALEDGRLAIAIGDVAGHGVSSGLVMAAAKSALAVQATFDPEVEAVFETLNRMVYQSARKRLIATLCYSLFDPVRRQLTFASAGHLYPYIVGADRRVRWLEATAYPLGVRAALPIRVMREQLEPGDFLVLLSDGVVEARPEGSTDLFGFDRLEESLARHAAGGVDAVRDGVLSDLARFVGSSPREDDQTLLVLRVP